MSLLSSLGLWAAFAAGALLYQATMPPCPNPVHVFVPQDCAPCEVTLAGKRKPSPPPGLRMQLWLRPQVALRTPADVYARIRVDDPRRVLQCPEWEVDWGERGIPSQWSSSCDPYGAIEDRPTLHVEPREGPRRHTYHVAGEYEVKGTVMDAFQRRSATGTVIVQGPRLP